MKSLSAVPITFAMCCLRERWAAWSGDQKPPEIDPIVNRLAEFLVRNVAGLNTMRGIILPKSGMGFRMIFDIALAWIELERIATEKPYYI